MDQLLSQLGGGSIVLEDLFDKVEVIYGGDARDYSTIKLANLQEGTYKLKRPCHSPRRRSAA